MDYLSQIKQPIEAELADFVDLFNRSLEHSDGLLSQVLDHIRQRGGKRMRPILILLMARNFGKISDVTQHSAVGLEMLHTASLVHDDVVDESGERRGQASVNATYNNKVAVLVGDYILSTALLQVSYSHSEEIVRYLAEVGRVLSNGEILQLSSISNEEISEDVYYQVIRQKTAALFEACAGIGALSVNASALQVEEAKRFGQNLGVIFQIRDDIFDYYDSREIGKPTGNDMTEGKLTLPIIYALKSSGDEEMLRLARKVKAREITSDEIAKLVAFTKKNGGIEYADKRMWDFHAECMSFLDNFVADKSIYDALKAYLDYVIERKKCKVFILCNPHNPGGITWSRETLLRLADFCYDHHLLVVSDEIHADMAIFGHKHIPFASVSDKARDICITFQAPSKTFNIAGIVSSYAVVPNEEIRKKFYTWLSANELDEPTLFAPIATIAAFRKGEEWRKQMLAYVEENIRFVEKFCKEHIPGVRPLRPQASFLVWLNCRDLRLSHDDLLDLFVDKAHLALNDGEMFGPGGEGFMRLNVAAPRSVLRQAMEQLAEAVKKIG